MPIDDDFATQGFSIKTAYYLANACAAAYLDALGDSAVELALGQDAATFQFADFHGFVAALDQAVLVAFRGTDNLENWMTDGRIIPVSNPVYPGQVHQGFNAAMEVIWPNMRGLLPVGARPIWVTGHSLGGALATLAALRLQAADFSVRAVYTYGSPRVGDPVFAASYPAPNYRFVNYNDLVPHVPSEQFLLGVPGQGIRLVHYQHVGTLEYLGRDGLLTDNPNLVEERKEFLLHSLTAAGGSVEPEAINDHRIANYIAAIKKNLS